MHIKETLVETQWEITETLHTEEFQQELFSIDDLSLLPASTQYLNSSFSKGIYFHQKKAIQEYLDGNNVCLATRTASGKSVAFYVAGIEELVQNPNANIIAIYPTRALGNEQQNRWQAAVDKAGLDVKVGRIDGSVKPSSRRPKILEDCRVLICTPDIIHAWFLSHLNEKKVLHFLQELSLIVVDEVHTYAGVFGSNAAFLFRRLRHLMNLMGKTPRFIGASATISKPKKHLESLLGLEFSIVDETDDTSPCYPLEIHLANPPGESDFLTEIVTLLKQLSTQSNTRFITFVDSRKQVELISSILARRHDTPPEEDDDSTDENNPDGFNRDILDSIDVLSYRSGYEEHDRKVIQERLSSAVLSGVISTSGLELGIDIPHLNTCVLVGIPRSATSLFQRIGRVGRSEKGHVIVVNTGDAYSEAVFAKPKSLLKRPLAESALYLENEYLQYIHALSLARLDGEHDQIEHGGSDSDFTSSIAWPEGFLEICKMERLGQVPRRLQSMKAESGDSPNYTFPLRDVESQFQIGYKRGPEQSSLGSISYSQLMREAYPGAVYYYATQPYRVYRVKQRSKEVLVRKTKRYTTKPQKLPTLVFPNITEENVFNSSAYGELLFVECNLQIRESINGIKERRGPNEATYNYPLSGNLGFYFNQNYFTRNYFTTGIVITHPIFTDNGVNQRVLADLLYEVFLLLVPFERQDINFAIDKHRTDIPPNINKGDPFVTIYDQTYGSLRLTSRLMESETIPKLFQVSRELAKELNYEDETPGLLAVLDSLIQEIKKGSSRLVFSTDTVAGSNGDSDDYQRVIMPGSKGLNINRGNEEFFVARVFLGRDGLRYEGETESFSRHKNKTASFPFVDDIVEIPGVSEVGCYNHLTGEVEPKDCSTDIQVIPHEKIVKDTKQIEIEKLRFVLNSYFTREQLDYLCNEVDLSYSSLAGKNQEEKVFSMVDQCDHKGQTENLLSAAYKLAMSLEET